MSAEANLVDAVCRWLHARGHKSAATDLDYNWNDPDQPGDGSCLPVHTRISPQPGATTVMFDGSEVMGTPVRGRP